MPHALVTGATGFVGHHLVNHLIESGDDVTCLVRESSDRSRLEPLKPRFVVGDVTDAESLNSAVDRVDVVYHVAGLTKSLHPVDLMKVNAHGARNIAHACSRRNNPPVLVMISSLAAAGPSDDTAPKTESDPTCPVSIYGRSKRAGERAVMRYASRVPTAIVRPPIVLGEEDRNSFQLFDFISKMRFHVVPSYTDHLFSVIHADDLALAIKLVAEKGSRLTGDEGDTTGIYFAAAEEAMTYEQLGRMIGISVGRPRAWMIRVPMSAVWGIAGFNEVLSKVQRRPAILNLDKARETAAGSWACSAKTLQRDTGFRPEKSIPERLSQTVDWYVEKGWMKRRSPRH